MGEVLAGVKSTRTISNASDEAFLAAGSFDNRRFDAVDHPWRVLWTKARQEKAVARQLMARGVDFFFPVVPRVRMIRGRKFRSQLPLFPGYVFMAGEREDGFDMISSKRVCQIIEPPDQSKLIEDLENVRMALAGQAPLELYPFAVVGRRCRVRIGPFEGIEGKITDRLGPDRLVLEIAVLGRGASLEIDADLLEPIE